MKKNARPRRGSDLARYLAVAALLVLAAWYGRSRSVPDIDPHLAGIYPDYSSFSGSNGVYSVLDGEDRVVGWAATGAADGYGGSMRLLVGLDPAGRVAGVSVIDQRETPVFWRMVRSSEFFSSIVGKPFGEIDYRYQDVVGVTGATRSADAIVASARQAVARVAGERFDTVIPLPRPPWEFGLLEIAIVVLFAAAVSSIGMKRSWQATIRWSCQAFGLLLIGFWADSPVTLTRLTGFISGYFPSLRTHLATYLLVGGFVLSVLVLGRSLYCSHLCPFGAVQRFINLIGGKRIRLPVWSVKLMRRLRDLIVLGAVVAALALARPGLAHYEPFAALFALTGSTLQWFLLLLVLLLSLIMSRPWCNFMCPMRTAEHTLQAIRGVAVRPDDSGGRQEGGQV